MLAVIDLTNETVGDAISDMLLVETVLHSYGWDVHQWLRAYKDLPCRQLKVSVKVNSTFKSFSTILHYLILISCYVFFNL